jgi:hypothetical protein
LRAILIVLVLVNVGWATWSVALRDDSHSNSGSNSIGSSPRTSPTGGAALALLSELPAPRNVAADPAPAAEGTNGVQSSATAPVAKAPAEVSANSSQACVVVGPFDDLGQVETLRDEILEQGGTAEVVEEEIDGRPDYLVYIHTTGSRVVARRMREELKAQVIDSHIIAGGDLQDALSVGVFSRERLAHAQYDRVSGLGYEAAVRPLPRRRTVYHLMTDRVAAAADVAGRVACHEIASANHFL